MDFEKFCDIRPLSAKEIGDMTAVQRKQKGWTQETLAEIAKVTVRTLQRVENGEASSHDTRRAIARALDWEDIDSFNKPWVLPNAEKMKEEKERLDRETVEVPIILITSGIRLRELAETIQGSAFHQGVDLSEPAERVLAELQDYFRDYGDIDDCYSAAQKLDVNQDFQRMIDKLSAAGFGLAGGTRNVRIVNEREKDDLDPLRMTVSASLLPSERRE